MTDSLDDYYVEKLSMKNIEDLYPLFFHAYGYNASINFFENKNKFSHGKETFVGFIAYDKVHNSPAAFYGVYPQYVSYNNNVYLLAQSGDTMTHPEHQKKGLFVFLAQTTIAYCKTIGIDAIFGFPNHNSYYGFINKLQFHETNTLKSLLVFENRLEYGRLFGKSSIAEKAARALLKVLFKKGQSFENSNCKKEGVVYVVHDTIFFQGKNTRNNLLLHFRKNTILISVREKSIIIGDIAIVNEQDVSFLLKRLKAICLLCGLRFISFIGSENGVLYNALDKKGKNSYLKNKSIFLKINSTLPFEDICYLGCDIDVF